MPFSSSYTSLQERDGLKVSLLRRIEMMRTKILKNLVIILVLRKFQKKEKKFSLPPRRLPLFLKKPGRDVPSGAAAEGAITLPNILITFLFLVKNSLEGRKMDKSTRKILKFQEDLNKVIFMPEKRFKKKMNKFLDYILELKKYAFKIKNIFCKQVLNNIKVVDYIYGRLHMNSWRYSFNVYKNVEFGNEVYVNIDVSHSLGDDIYVYDSEKGILGLGTRMKLYFNGKIRITSRDTYIFNLFYTLYDEKLRCHPEYLIIRYNSRKDCLECRFLPDENVLNYKGNDKIYTTAIKYCFLKLYNSKLNYVKKIFYEEFKLR